MAGTLPNVLSVVTKEETTISIIDIGRIEDNDRVSIEFNGDPVPGASSVEATSLGTPVTLPPLIPGVSNTVRVTAVSGGTADSATIGVTLDDWIYGEEFFENPNLNPGGSIVFTVALPTIRIDSQRHPESAQHVVDTLGRATVFTLDLNDSNRDARRSESLGDFEAEQGRDPITPVTGFERDEVPYARFEEGGTGASVRPIPSSDNEGSGGDFGQQIRSYGPENKALPDDSQVDFWVTEANVLASRALTLAPSANAASGTNGVDYLYGNSLPNSLDGRQGDDVIFGYSDRDTLFGREGDDALFGNQGSDTLIGGEDNDSLVGGLGADILWGDANTGALGGGEDIIVLDVRADYTGDIVKDFELAADEIKLWPNNNSASEIQNIGIRDINRSGVAGTDIFSLRRGTSFMFLENVTTAQIDAVGGLSSFASRF